jgi:hypothetical protein
MDDQRLHARGLDVVREHKLAREVPAKPVSHEKHHLQLGEKMLAYSPAFSARPTHQAMMASGVDRSAVFGDGGSAAGLSHW